MMVGVMGVYRACPSFHGFDNSTLLGLPINLPSGLGMDLYLICTCSDF